MTKIFPARFHELAERLQFLTRYKKQKFEEYCKLYEDDNSNSEEWKVLLAEALSVSPEMKTILAEMEELHPDNPKNKVAP